MNRFIGVVMVMLLFASCGGGDSFNGERVVLTKHHFFTSENEGVNFYIQATDRNKRGIVGLTNEDFSINENGISLLLADSRLEVKTDSDLGFKMRVVVLIDNGSSAESNLSEVKTSVNSFIDGLVSDKVEIAIYTFSLGTQRVIDFTTDKEALKRAVDGIRLGNHSTDLFGAVVKSSSLLQDSYSDNIVEQGVLLVYTDGRENRGNTTLTELKEAIKDKRIYTIGYTGGDIDSEQLQMIGSAGFFKARTNMEISEKFDFAKNEIANYAGSFYWLKYRSPKVNDKENTVELTINNSNKFRRVNTIEAKFHGFEE